MRKTCFLFVFLALLFNACSKDEQADQQMPEASKYGDQARVLTGEPAFPALEKSWIIDKANAVSLEVERTADAVLQSLQDDGLAEVVVLIITGVKKPGDYATQYGRFLQLGKAGPASDGGNRGIVWLVRPDADEKMTISVGRGLPGFTSQDYGEIMDAVGDYCQFNNYDKCVQRLAEKTSEVLRRLQKVKP